MKKTILWGILAVCLLPGLAFADKYVKGYTKRDGTYVAPHYRSNPNSTRFDNYSTQGNVNPYNGNVGTKPLYDSGSLYRAPKIKR